MIALEAKVKKWGNSLGIVLPKEMALKRNISEDDQVKIVITRVGRKNASRRLWGALHNWKAPSEELEKFVDKEFDLPV